MSAPSIAVFVYLLAIVVADLTVAHFGQWALVFTAWVLIPLDLVLRDLLHDAWSRDGLFFWRMATLVLGGSALSFLINSAAGPVAVASLAAFLASGLAATVIYQLMLRRPRLVKMNVAGAVSSVLDSVIFPVIAFNAFDWRLSATQAASKFAGGVVWSVVFVRLLKRGPRP